MLVSAAEVSRLVPLTTGPGVSTINRMGDLDLGTDLTVEEVLGDTDEDRTHIVTRDELERSRRTGEAVIAFCGKKWVPRRNPDNYPLCPACVKVWEAWEKVWD